MIKILNKQTEEVITIYNASKCNCTKDSFINRDAIGNKGLSNLHNLYDYKLIIRQYGNKGIFQFLLKDHLEVIL